MSRIMERSLPSNIDAERAILGAILVNNDSFYRAAEVLTPEDFYVDSHRVMFRTMVSMRERSATIDMVTLQDQLLMSGDLERCGGIGYIGGLMAGIPHLTNVENYAAIVSDKSMLRQMIHAGSKAISDCFDQAEDTETILSSAEQAILQLTSKRVRAGLVSSAAMYLPTSQLLEQLYNDRQLVTGVATGFTDLDRMTSGMQNGDLIILAARPSMGKTALALNIAANVTMRRGLPVAMFSLEMSKEQLMLRMMCAESHVDAHKVRTGYVDAGEYDQLRQGLSNIAHAPFYCDDSSTMGVMEMRAKCRRMKAEHGLGLVVVDYLGLMAGQGKQESRQQEVSQISRGLKGLAKDLGVPVLALSQLNRSPETRSGDHKPQLSDLRDSGSIEQDADCVMFLYREEVYKPSEENVGRADLILAKQRNGPTGTVRLAFLKQFTKFENMLEVY